jgi:hypothetical protein
MHIDKTESSEQFSSEVNVPDQFEIPRQDAEYVIESTVGVLSHPEVALKAQQIHGRCYVEYGYVDKSALMDDGRLVPELDNARDGDKVIVNYLLARGKDKTIEEAGATLRMIDIGKNGTIEDLPTYRYFSDVFESSVKTKLQNLVDLYGTKSVREIAALGAVNRADTDSSYELMRAVMQNSLIKENNYGQREFYIASLTKVSLYPIKKFAGRSAIEILGGPIRVHADDPRQKTVYVTPVLMYPNKTLDGIIDDIESAEKNSDISKLVQKLHYLTDGLTTEQVSKRVARFLYKIDN